MLTPLEPRLSKKLQEPLTTLIHSTSAMSLLYECVSTMISGMPKNVAAMQLCVSKLRLFVEDVDQNCEFCTDQEPLTVTKITIVTITKVTIAITISIITVITITNILLISVTILPTPLTPTLLSPLSPSLLSSLSPSLLSPS